jgi:hypothetical protein
MSVSLVTLSNYLYKDSRQRLIDSAISHGIDSVKSLDFEDVKKSDFYQKNENVLSNEKYMGYWLWKPYIILDAIERLNDNDILIYIDAGVEIIDSLESIIEECRINSDIIVCGNANDLNNAWTKRDCFVLMGCDSERFWHASHCDASFLMFKKTPTSISFLQQWLGYGTNINIISDLPNVCGLPNLPEYVDHRYDQSILSILAEKFQLPLYRVASQFGNHYKSHPFRMKGEFNCVNQMNQKQLDYYYFLPYYNSPYGQLLNHHRKRNVINKEQEVEQVKIQNNYFFLRVLRFVKRKIGHLVK